jgi:glycosyltransferase involved in cell wall biosynthesis
MSSMRLLLVTDAVGGVWVYSLELARALRTLDVETVIAVMGPSPNAKQRRDAAGFDLIDTGLPLEWFDTSAAKMRGAGRVLAEIAEREHADLVQTCSAALLAAADFAQPCIAVQHSCVASWWAAVKGTPLPPDFEWRREMVGEGLGRASAVITPSLSFAAETARIYGLATVNTVHNGRRAAVPPNIPQGEFVFTAGRLWDEGKNVATLDAAAARIGAPFQAAGATDGPNGARIALQHIQTLGELSDTRLAGLFAARPIYASAALYEPFGLSVLEAAQAGCALVLSDIPTHREIWDESAIFVPPREDETFAAVIEFLLEDADEREELGQLARSRASHYTPERMTRGMAELYARVAAAAVAPQPMAGVA